VNPTTQESQDRDLERVEVSNIADSHAAWLKIADWQSCENESSINIGNSNFGNSPVYCPF